jgi:hypothetical protein
MVARVLAGEHARGRWFDGVLADHGDHGPGSLAGG